MSTIEGIYPKAPPRSIDRYDEADRTIGREIKRLAGLQPDHMAVASSGFPPLSYRQLHCLIEEARAALRRRGFARSARIAIAMPDGPQAALAILAVGCSAVSIPLNPRHALGETKSFLVTFGRMPSSSRRAATPTPGALRNKTA